MVAHRNSADSKPLLAIKPLKRDSHAPAMKVRAVVATQDRPRGPHAPAMRARRRTPCPCGEGAKTHTAPCRLRSAPTSRKHCGACAMGECNADAPIAAEGSMVPLGTPGSFIAAARQCCPDRQRQHISAAYPRNTLPWQHSAAVRSRAAGRGNISPKCIPGLPAMAIFRRGAFSGVQSWRDYAVVRSRAAIRGGFFTSCVPEGASDGKNASSRQHIAAMYPKRAGFGKICAPCIRKAPQTGVRGCTARRSCQEGALFAARAPQIMHGTRVLPSFGA